MVECPRVPILIILTGIDMMYAFLAHYYSDDEAGVQNMINGVEYAPHTDPHWDPFSIVHNVSNTPIGAG